MQLGFEDHEFPDGALVLELWWCFRCGCAADMDNVTDGGLLALVGAGVGPALEHLDFHGESAYFQFNSWCFSVIVYTSSPFQFGVDRSVDFRVLSFGE